jgi:hypothetical protein
MGLAVEACLTRADGRTERNAALAHAAFFSSLLAMERVHWRHGHYLSIHAQQPERYGPAVCQLNGHRFRGVFPSRGFGS